MTKVLPFAVNSAKRNETNNTFLDSKLGYIDDSEFTFKVVTEIREQMAF
jgi:hypothetical protein